MTMSFSGCSHITISLQQGCEIDRIIKILSMQECTLSYFLIVAVLGIAGPRPKSSVGPLFEVLTCFPVISFQFFLRYGAPSGLSKARSLRPWPPGLPGTATVPSSTL